MAEQDGGQYNPNTDTSQIKTWRSIITLVVFVLTNIIVLFPFHIPVYVPQVLSDAVLETLVVWRIIPPKQKRPQNGSQKGSMFVRFRFPMNFVTAPLVADLFLLAILAIGRKEVHDGTVGANNISPIDIMLFFLSLAYIAISIDASGLIRYLAFRVLKWGGDVGHRLFGYLYLFFFALTSFIGNDPVILSGTAFLAYMTRVSSNIVHPRAWIYSQFAVANIASAILVSSNPTNLVIAGAFDIKFIKYTANIIVPVVVTGIVLFPFLLYIVFADESLIPLSIEMHELPEEARGKAPVNPNIPNAKLKLEEQGDDEPKLLPLEEIMNPFLDRSGAWFGGIMMAITLVTLLVLNAVMQGTHHMQVFWVTLPAAFIMFCWDIAYGWRHRDETRRIARESEAEVEVIRERRKSLAHGQLATSLPDQEALGVIPPSKHDEAETDLEMQDLSSPESSESRQNTVGQNANEKHHPADNKERKPTEQETLVSLFAKTYQWSQETFPTATTVLAHLPFALVPFALCMFVLVQALVTRGWVPVFAHGWDHWVNKTGTVGAIGGMGFLSVILCNFAGTNIGTSILLSRVIQSWQDIHRENGTPISDRTFWATIYSLALGVNYGAFSAAFSASLAGLLWRDILRRKHIRVHSLDFARVNLPIISITMIVGCSVLVGQVYIMRDNSPYVPIR